jgi:ribonucleoside-diphosphate reductase alpha chain
MGRLISLALRSGIPLMEIHKQLRGISSDRAVGLGPNKVLSVPDAIGIALYDWYQEKQLGIQQELLRESRGPSTPVREEITVSHATPGGEQAQLSFDPRAESFIGTCPDCGSQLEYAEGCVKCHVCGFSECG